MSTTRQPRDPSTERTLGQLVADATNDVSTIVRNEIALAKAEITTEAKTAGKGAAMFAAAGFVGLLGLIFLFHTIAQVIAIWLPLWAGYLITTALLFLVAAVLALVGRRSMQKMKGKPERTIKNAQETISTLKSGS
ncbi:phage holin family protein [Pedococcus sp. 5OH_020]|uniref:phage holin family protein n=1 Tax=Pedococcus sp. 5OH_020 TaxID=2989814 RepID=UPI0022E9E7DE|nr:phage holin family protein [Pedococcus sp. 5OH_020]